jgi:CIC family chloride channel protein
VAVFGAAARVPFATALMVAEMTGGYQLLVPAAIALTVSCATQANLSRRRKYKSLYEAQVPSSSDSPAHYVELVGTALKLLRDRPGPVCSGVDCVNLVDLLESGIPVELPDGRHMSILELHSDSPHVGKEAHPDVLFGPDADKDLVAVIRGGEVLVPHFRHRLSPGDKVLIITPGANDVSADSIE